MTTRKSFHRNLSAENAQRTLPHNLDTEASILGGVLLNNECLALVPNLEIDDFYDHRHKVVFQALRNLEAKGFPYDVVTVENEIERTGKLAAIGGVAFLGELALRVPTPDNVETYAKIVQGHAITRSVMMMLSDMLDEAFTGESEGEQLIHDVTTAMMMIKTGGEEPIRTMAELIAAEAQRVTDDVEKRLRGEFVFAGVPTGVQPLDTHIGGHPIGLQTLYIGRPGMGKSTVSMLFAESSRELASMETLVASYEDSGESFAQRGLAKNSGIQTSLIRARRLDAPDLIEIGAAWAASSHRTECLLSCSGMTVEALARRVRRENVRRRSLGKKPLRQLIVDYIQKMPQPEWARSRDEGISHISQHLCNLAVAEQMAVVSMCQLNREVERRDDHRPRLSDIRDSGSLEQDGKLIVGLYHPWSYTPDKHPEHEHHLLILKNHQGESSSDIRMYWDRKRHAIYNTELEYQQARTRR